MIFEHVLRFLLFAAGNEPCPQPQTSEHLAAIEIMQLKHILIMQNKIDIVKESQAKDQYDQIMRFVQGVYFVNGNLLMLPGIMVTDVVTIVNCLTQEQLPTALP